MAVLFHRLAMAQQHRDLVRLDRVGFVATVGFLDYPGCHASLGSQEALHGLSYTGYPFPGWPSPTCGPVYQVCEIGGGMAGAFTVLTMWPFP